MIRVEGLSLEKFLNMALESGITVFEVQRVSYTVLRALVSSRGYRKLQRIAPEKYGVSVEKAAGVPFMLRWLMHRKALLVGLACVGLALLAASLFVWDISVSGLEYREAAALKEEIGKQGLFVGAYKNSIDLKEIETRLMVTHEEFAWVDLYIKGVVAEVEVVLAELPPEMVDESRPCNIVATKDALVESITALKGRAAVSPGDTVRADDVLISGLIWDEGLPPMLFAARGDVVGSVWYMAQASAPVYSETRIPTGRTQTQRVISIGADSAPVDDPCAFGEYDTRVVDTYNIVGLFLPVKMTTLEHSEVRLERKSKPMDSLKVYLEERAFYNAQGLAPGGADIVGHKVVFEEKDDVMTATVYVQTHENIGKVVYLED